MNALGACKAVLRGRPETADGLLPRGFHRIGEPDPTGGWAHRIAAGGKLYGVVELVHW